MLWATMFHFEPQWPKKFTLWPSVTQNKVLGPSIFLKFVPKILFWGKFGPKLESALFKIKLDKKEYSREVILNSTIFFLHFDPKYLFWANLVPKRQSVLFRMKICTKRYSGVLIPNSTIVFLCSILKIPFWGKFGPAASKCFV